MLRFKEHCILAAITVCLWILFYILGIPSDYFQKWSFTEQLILSVVTFFAVGPFLAFVIIILLNRSYIKTGIWLAFYFSVLPAVMDFIVCGVIQGGGAGIFISHWYLTVGYFYVWIIGPLVGITLQKLKSNWIEKEA